MLNLRRRKKKPSKIYYSHSMGIYGTDREKKEIRYIQKHFPDAKVINPNGFVKSQIGWMAMMECFELIDACDCLVFSAGEGAYIGRGVASEIEWAEESGAGVYMLVLGHLVPLSFLRIVPRSIHDWRHRYAQVEFLPLERILRDGQL